MLRDHLSMVIAVAVTVLVCAATAGASGIGNGNGNGNGDDEGDNGQQGSQGGSLSANWGLMARNTLGSPVGDPRWGPTVSTPTGVSSPPFGVGSLGIEVQGGPTWPGALREKVAFGNEVDFLGKLVTGLTQVGFRVFQTGENAGVSPDNLPNITFEVDPSGLSSSTPPNYSSLVWNPNGTGVPINQWSGYIDATTNGGWYFTNGVTAATTGCTLAAPCPFTQMKTAVAANYPNMAELTAAVSKGRDYQYVGAVDGLRINNKVYDFEPSGTRQRSP
jgi:hypothetical protein